MGELVLGWWFALAHGLPPLLHPVRRRVGGHPLPAPRPPPRTRCGIRALGCGWMGERQSWPPPAPPVRSGVVVLVLVVVVVVVVTVCIFAPCPTVWVPTQPRVEWCTGCIAPCRTLRPKPSQIAGQPPPTTASTLALPCRGSRALCHPPSRA